ncbi:MAG: hypothetical protein IKA36_05030 [Clostridia bacterium]|nr:hypothetical protein [Clostridia bacterium]
MLYRFDSDYRRDFAVLKSKINSQNQLSFARTDISRIDFEKKSIIILCGNNSRSLSRAEFYSYLCRGWVRNMKKNSELSTYAIFYPNNQPLFNEYPYIELDYEGLANQMFQKVLFKDDKLKSVEDIKKSLSNVVFFGHSAGGYVMNNLMNNFAKIMVKNKFSRSDIRKIFESIVFIGYAPYSLVDAPVKAIYIAPVYDSMGSAKLVYKKMLKSKNVRSSKPRMDLFGQNKITARVNSNFMGEYKKKVKGKNTLYFSDKNSIVTTPNLLYNDGNKEDHNFAGVINYKSENPNQTKAGKSTAKFLNHAFDYCLSTSREKFNINEIYNQALRIDLSDEELKLEN